MSNSIFPARVLPRAGLLALVLVLSMGAVAPARADDDTKIGVIDSQRIFSEYQEAIDAEAAFQEEMKVWQQELGTMEREIILLQERIRSQQLLLSQEKLDELQRDYQTKAQAYDQKRTEILDPTSGLAVKRNQELSKPINDQITTVVERLGAEGKYRMILDVATVNVVYIETDADLTDEVLQELEKSGN